MSPLLVVITKALRTIAPIAIRDFGEAEELRGSAKGNTHFIEETATTINARLEEALAKARPEFGFNQKGANQWLLEPLDGVENFRRGIPHFGVAIGARDETAEVVASGVYDPLRGELFYAGKGEGTFLADHKGTVRLRIYSNLRPRLVVVGSDGSPPRTPRQAPSPKAPQEPTPETPKETPKETPQEPTPETPKETPQKTPQEATPPSPLMRRNLATIRSSGSLALDLAWVASSRYNGCLYEGQIHPAVLAATLIVRESGGLVSGDTLSPKEVAQGQVAHKLAVGSVEN